MVLVVDISRAWSGMGGFKRMVAATDLSSKRLSGTGGFFEKSAGRPDTNSNDPRKASCRFLPGNGQIGTVSDWYGLKAVVYVRLGWEPKNSALFVPCTTSMTWSRRVTPDNISDQALS
jgi:hypothetical protein